MCTEICLDDILKRVIKVYKDVYGDRIVEIILYGSYARGDYNNESDVDITAVVKGERRELQDKLRSVWDASADIGLENDVIVSPTVIPEDEFEKYKWELPYYRNIMTEGKRIG